MAESKKAVLTGRKLFIGIPCYDGKINVKTAYALAQLMPEAMRLGVAITLSDISNCSIITLARNSLVAEFLKTDCTDLLFIDADVVVTPDDILRLLAQAGTRIFLLGHTHVGLETKSSLRTCIGTRMRTWSLMALSCASSAWVQGSCLYVATSLSR